MEEIDGKNDRLNGKQRKLMFHIGERRDHHFAINFKLFFKCICEKIEKNIENCVNMQ